MSKKGILLPAFYNLRKKSKESFHEKEIEFFFAEKRIHKNDFNCITWINLIN
jgi:hypothetical protein